MQKQKIIYISFSLVIFLLSVHVALTAKNEGEKAQPDIVSIGTDVPSATSTDIPVSREIESVRVAGESYLGKWKRVGMVINGENVSFSPSIIEIEEGKFIQTTDCTVSGALSINNGKMMMEVLEDGCGQGEKTFVNGYSLLEDNNKLVLSIDEPGFKVQDIYQRTNK